MHKPRQRKKQQWKLLQKILVCGFAIAIFISGLIAPKPAIVEAVNSPNIPISLPLSTRGTKIVDAKGKEILLRGVNWFGMETETHTPHGLWQRDYKEMLAQIKSLGYNSIRLPFAVEALRSDKISGVDFSIGANKELEGKTPLEVMDAVIQEAEKNNLLIILDSHRLNVKRIPELWYGDGYTEADWINVWKNLAQRYKSQKNIIGADLKNEPHGRASWGTNDLATDWRLAAERAGNAILGINPDWLIIVEGVEKNVPGQKQKNYWWGANLEGVRRYPVRLSRRNKLVYSPHEYGQGVAKMPYFEDKSFPGNMTKRWETGFYYIVRRRIAPVWVGEFGGRNIDNKSAEGIWQNKFMNFIRDKNLGFAYWSWNPNSADTGGILLDDWQTVDAPKQVLLSRMLPIKFTPPPTPIARISPPSNNSQSRNSPITNSNQQKPSNSNQANSPKPASTAKEPTANKPVSTRLEVAADIYSNWQNGFCISFKVSNPNNLPVKAWQLGFNMNQASIYNSWNADFKQKNNNEYLVNPADWGQTIDPNQVRDIGFCANKLGEDYQPKNIQVQPVK